jgi:pimeloyl-ACP methyl ester carboxylesterase
MTWQEFQSKQRLIEIGNRFVSYLDTGSGDAVIMIHGIPTWGYLWSPILPALVSGLRVLVPDLLGFGYSDKSDCFDRSIAAQASAIDQWMEKLGLSRATVVGHDIGGGVALRLATLFPARVERLCLLDSACYDSWPTESMLQLGNPDAYRRLSAPRALILLMELLKQGFASSPSDEFLNGVLAPYATEIGRLSLIRSAASLNTNLTTQITSLLPQLKVPTLVLWGEHDQFQVAKYGERLASDIPGAKFVSVKGAGHFVMVDRPEEVSERILEFLASRRRLPMTG